MSRQLLFIVVIVTMAVAAGLLFKHSSNRPGQGQPGEPLAADLPVTPATPDEAAKPLSGVHLDALDLTTRPQDDFYQFANGGWLDSTEIPDIYSGYTVYHQVREVAEEALKRIIEEAGKNPGEAGSEARKIGDFYNSWMDQQTIDALGIDPVREDIEAIAAVNDRQALVSLMARLYRSGVMMPFGFYIYPDLKDSENYAVYFRQSGLTMPNRDYYLETDNENFASARDGLPAYVRDMLLIAGYDEAAAKQGAEAVYAIEARIAAAHWDSVRNRDPQQAYNPHTWAQLESLAPSLDWRQTAAVLGVAGEDKLIIRQPSFFETLGTMITETGLEDWRAYLTFRLLDSSAFHLDQATADTRFVYRNRTLSGQQQERPRWKRGISVVNGAMGEAVGKLYVAQYFPPEAKAKMLELVGNVTATLDDNLGELPWMSQQTREQARVKLSRFTAKIGYPDVWKDYTDLEVVAGDHFGNRLRANEWEHAQEIAKLGKPIDRNEWGMTPQTVNAYYSPGKNEIVFPAARLQPPFFQLNADEAINYGAVGGVIGHEISHGFDDKGSQFDGDGNLVDWWTEQDRAKFDERTRVLVEQYNRFSPVEGMHVDGELTLGENIGDLSGVTMAYRAYVNSLDGAEAPVIDGFTGAQRFFIGYAMSRKGKYREAATVRRLASDTHAPLEFRVNGVYRNIDAFHEAFGTREGDGMWLAPEERVRLW